MLKGNSIAFAMLLWRLLVAIWAVAPRARGKRSNLSHSSTCSNTTSGPTIGAVLLQRQIYYNQIQLQQRTHSRQDWATYKATNEACATTGLQDATYQNCAKACQSLSITKDAYEVDDEDNPGCTVVVEGANAGLCRWNKKKTATGYWPEARRLCVNGKCPSPLTLAPPDASFKKIGLGYCSDASDASPNYYENNEVNTDSACRAQCKLDDACVAYDVDFFGCIIYAPTRSDAPPLWRFSAGVHGSEIVKGDGDECAVCVRKVKTMNGGEVELGNKSNETKTLKLDNVTGSASSSITYEPNEPS